MNAKQVIALFLLTMFLAANADAADSGIVLVVEQNQITRVISAGKTARFLPEAGLAAAWEGELHVFRAGEIRTYDATGNRTRTIPVPALPESVAKLIVLPDKAFALLDYVNDKIYFLDSQGRQFRTLSILNAKNQQLQQMGGVVVGKRLIIAGNEADELIAVDLGTYEQSVFMPMQFGLCGVTNSYGRYFISCKRQDIYSFVETEPSAEAGARTSSLADFRKLVKLPQLNITGIAAGDRRVYAVVNGLSKLGRVALDMSLDMKRATQVGILYEIDASSGTFKPIATGLNFPTDVVLLDPKVQ